MRLLLVADLHYSLPQFDWVLDMAGRFDVVVMAGDHLDIGSMVDGRAQSIVVDKYFSRLRAKTSSCSAPAIMTSTPRTSRAKGLPAGSARRAGNDEGPRNRRAVGGLRGPWGQMTGSGVAPLDPADDVDVDEDVLGSSSATQSSSSARNVCQTAYATPAAATIPAPMAR